MPALVQPMLARLSPMPMDDPQWAFEIKWDGVRAIARSRPGRLRLLSRAGNDVTDTYPELGRIGDALGERSAILDGEIVAFDETGRPSFEALAPRMHLRDEGVVQRLARERPVTYVVFDLLWLDDASLMELPYSERRARLRALKLDGPRWVVPEPQIGDGAALLAATSARGLEGIVAKRLDSRYLPGSRDGGWLKIKHHHRQETVIGGWTDGRGTRSARIGALHLGVHDEHGALRYAGKVGTGFDVAELDRLAELLAPLARARSPFTGAQPARRAHFVQPRLVCEVEFTQWTRDGLLRHAVYKGLRDDKPAAQVTRERTAPSERPVPHPPGERPERTPTLDELLEDGRRVRGGVEVELEGRVLKLTNLDKVLYPQTGFTKADLVRYHLALAPTLLAHLRGRPLTLKRYPDGVNGEYFYEKQCPRHAPEWVARTEPIWAERGGRGVRYCLCEDAPTLVWLANLADLELHPSLSLAAALDRPTALAFDLDPGAPAGIVECCGVALQLRALFAELGMDCYAKTSGSKGMQVYVPLNRGEATYAQTKLFAHAVADLLERRHPRLAVASMAKAQRAGRVFIDWSQNDEHKTTVAAYSLRAMDAPAVSTPLDWSEVRECHEHDGQASRGNRARAPLAFDHHDVLARVTERGDLFADVLSLRQALPALED